MYVMPSVSKFWINRVSSNFDKIRQKRERSFKYSQNRAAVHKVTRVSDTRSLKSTWQS